MRKLYGDRIKEQIGEGGDVVEFEDYFPIEAVESEARFTDSYTEIQSAIYAHISENSDREVNIDELAEVAAEVDRNDVRNLAYGAAIALRNLELIEFNSLTMAARKKT